MSGARHWRTASLSRRGGCSLVKFMTNLVIKWWTSIVHTSSGKTLQTNWWARTAAFLVKVLCYIIAELMYHLNTPRITVSQKTHQLWNELGEEEKAEKVIASVLARRLLVNSQQAYSQTSVRSRCSDFCETVIQGAVAELYLSGFTLMYQTYQNWTIFHWQSGDIIMCIWGRP